MEVNKKGLPRLLFITRSVVGMPLSELVEKACEGGVELVQLRMKGAPLSSIREVGKAVKAICSERSAILTINDHVDIAREVGAEGVHLGKGDTDPAEARRILGNDALIGGTANTFEDIKAHYEKGVDYIGLGPYRQTGTKEQLEPVLGLEGYRKILQKCEVSGISLPIFAIGGIEVGDVKSLRAIGVYGVALSSAIADASDIRGQAGAFVEALRAGEKDGRRGTSSN